MTAAVGIEGRPPCFQPFDALHSQKLNVYKTFKEGPARRLFTESTGAYEGT